MDKILGVGNKGGSLYHRIQLPLSYLKADFSTKLTEDLFAKYDSIWFHYKCSIHPTQLSLWRLKYGTQIVMDIDDTWNIPTSHPSYTQLKETVKWSKQYAIIADWVVCSTPEVEQMVKPYNENTIVIPNRIPYGEGQYHVYEESLEDFMNRKIRIGFCGSISHLEDWDSISGKLKRVITDLEVKQKCEFVVCGYPNPKDIPLPDQLVEEATKYAAEKGLNVQKVIDLSYKKHIERNTKMWNKICFNLGKPKIVYGRPVQDYIDLYREIDILLAPLVDNDLNRLKSSLKIFECACTNTIPILGKPYQTKELGDQYPIEDWYNNIKSLIKDKEKLYYQKMEISKRVRSLYDYQTDCVEPRKSILGKMKQIDLDITGIVYKEDQLTEYKPYFNKVKSISEGSYLFENLILKNLYSK